jgi:hypothetical protein
LRDWEDLREELRIHQESGGVIASEQVKRNKKRLDGIEEHG